MINKIKKFFNLILSLLKFLSSIFWGVFIIIFNIYLLSLFFITVYDRFIKIIVLILWELLVLVSKRVFYLLKGLICFWIKKILKFFISNSFSLRSIETSLNDFFYLILYFLDEFFNYFKKNYLENWSLWSSWEFYDLKNFLDENLFKKMDDDSEKILSQYPSYRCNQISNSFGFLKLKCNKLFKLWDDSFKKYGVYYFLFFYFLIFILLISFGLTFAFYFGKIIY